MNIGIYKQKNFFLLLFIVLTVIAVFLLINATRGSARPAVLSADTAVALAIRQVNAGFPAGRLEGNPVEVRGRVLPYQQAFQLAQHNRGTLGSSTDNSVSVWFLVMRGKVIVSIPGAADGSVPPTELIYPQMSVIVDGKTGELLSFMMHAPDDELTQATLQELPTLSIPATIVDFPPTPAPRPTTVPAPTASLPNN